MQQCLTCGGTYAPILPDGMQYFHVCPPLSVPELEAAVTAGKVVLPKDETAEIAVQRRMYERAQKRDENVVPSLAANTPATMKSAGKGVTDLGVVVVDTAPVIVDV